MKGEKIIDKLVATDPAVSWQVKKYLLNMPEEVYENDRRQIETTGWGAGLLAHRQPDGMWGGGLYSPKWISTNYTLLQLQYFGLPENNPAAKESAEILINADIAEDGGISLHKTIKFSETCVTGMYLLIGSYFNVSYNTLHRMAEFLLASQMPDGGWNCRLFFGATHGSFHTTINVLEGLNEYRRLFPEKNERIEASVNKAAEFLLLHKLFRSHRTGEIVDKRMTMLSFPCRWRYDILRALEFFVKIDYPYDARMQDSLDILLKKQRPGGMWPLQNKHSGIVFFDMEQPGKPSAWNTLRALRVLNKYC